MTRSSSRISTAALLATAGLSIASVAIPSAQAASSLFSEQSVNESQFVVMAAPRNSGDYNLVVLEQKSGRRDCWTESNGIVNPLLLNFDFSGICGRATDSNGYSVRMAGEDLGLKYSLRLVDKGDYVALLAAPNRRNQSTFEIGRTQSTAKDFLAVELNPGWNLSRRVYDGKPLGHLYFSNQQSLATAPSVTPAPATRPVSVQPVATTPAPAQPVATEPDVITIGQPLPEPPAVTGSNRPTSPAPTSSVPILVEQEFADEFAASEVPVIDEPGVIGAGGDATGSETAFNSQSHYNSLNALYQEVLGREIDPAGLATYAKKLDQGKSLSWVSDRLRNSDEGQAIAINRLYQEVLGREADAGGLQTYRKRLDRGWNLSQVRRDLANSKEARQRMANR